MNMEAEFDEIKKRLASLEDRVMDLEFGSTPIDDHIALSLTVPDALRKTLFAVAKLGEATAVDVSKYTQRHRTMENRHLNELVRSGWLNEKRISKKKYYSLKRRVDQQQSVLEINKALDDLLGE